MQKREFILHRSLRGFAAAFILCLAGSAFAGEPATDDSKLPQTIQEAATFAPPSSSWSFGGGYQWRQLGALNFQTGSHAASAGLPWMAGRALNSVTSVTAYSSAGGSTGPNGLGNHVYSNGYVNEDSSGASGTTWNWGYTSASQIQGNTLTFQSGSASASNTTYVTTTINAGFSGQSSSLRPDLGNNSDLNGSGWYVRLESPAFFSKNGFTLTGELGYSYVGSGSAHNVPGVFQAQQQTVQHSATSTTATTTTNNVTDAYDITGIIPPPAPYAGSFNGPGPVINETPISRSSTPVVTNSLTPGPRSTRVQTADFVSNVNESMHVDLNTVSIGPRASWEWQRLQLGFSTGFALNIADWNANYAETVLVRQNGGPVQTLSNYAGHSSGTKALPGLYTELSAQFFITKHVSLFGGGRYDWSRNLQVPDSASSASLDLHGWTVMGGLNYAF